MDRLNTNALMQRKNWHIDGGSYCVLCDSHEMETCNHLFFTCLFAVACWNMIEIHAILLFLSRTEFWRLEVYSGGIASWKFLFVRLGTSGKRGMITFLNPKLFSGLWRVRFQSDLQLHTYQTLPSATSSRLDSLLLHITSMCFNFCVHFYPPWCNPSVVHLVHIIPF
jgi:hypothetical protein